jgi:triosephosphate isomerase
MTIHKLIVANWKMNGSLDSVRKYGAELTQKLEVVQDHTKVVIAPPYPYLMFMDGRLVPAHVVLAAQDCSAKGEKGAFTGDVSAAMLKDVGCQYVIIGHSERRQHFQDTNAIVAAKLQFALTAGLIPILCVGETLAEKEAGQTEAIVNTQLEEALKDVKDCKELVIAYEPVWSIGTGKVATSSDITSMCTYIQRFAKQKGIPVTVLYGGSVNADNAREILHLEGVDGVLVGGASLTLDTFWPILSAA